MKVHQLDDMTKGWFVGQFSPTLVSTTEVEIAVKNYKAGEYEPIHHHKIATEITVITAGTVRMNGIEYSAGAIIVLEPNDASDFCAISDVTSTVVKIPGAPNDKYQGAAQ
jgi:quercetin dioxygenase-like cupin family protein